MDYRFKVEAGKVFMDVDGTWAPCTSMTAFRNVEIPSKDGVYEYDGRALVPATGTAPATAVKPANLTAKENK